MPSIEYTLGLDSSPLKAAAKEASKAIDQFKEDTTKAASEMKSAMETSVRSMPATADKAVSQLKRVTTEMEAAAKAGGGRRRMWDTANGEEAAKQVREVNSALKAATKSAAELNAARPGAKNRPWMDAAADVVGEVVPGGAMLAANKGLLGKLGGGTASFGLAAGMLTAAFQALKAISPEKDAEHFDAAWSKSFRSVGQKVKQSEFGKISSGLAGGVVAGVGDMLDSLTSAITGTETLRAAQWRLNAELDYERELGFKRVDAAREAASAVAKEEAAVAGAREAYEEATRAARDRMSVLRESYQAATQVQEARTAADMAKAASQPGFGPTDAVKAGAAADKAETAAKVAFLDKQAEELRTQIVDLQKLQAAADSAGSEARMKGAEAAGLFGKDAAAAAKDAAAAAAEAEQTVKDLDQRIAALKADVAQVEKEKETTKTAGQLRQTAAAERVKKMDADTRRGGLSDLPPAPELSPAARNDAPAKTREAEREWKQRLNLLKAEAEGDREKLKNLKDQAAVRAEMEKLIASGVATSANQARQMAVQMVNAQNQADVAGEDDDGSDGSGRGPKKAGQRRPPRTRYQIRTLTPEEGAARKFLRQAKRKNGTKDLDEFLKKRAPKLDRDEVKRALDREKKDQNLQNELGKQTGLLTQIEKHLAKVEVK